MVIWLIGMSGAGKTVIGKDLYNKLKKEYSNLVFLDGDDFRTIFGNDVGYTIEDRKKNADRFYRMCKYLDKNGINVIVSILSIFPELRELNRKNYSAYFEVYIEVAFDVLIRRDSKGLYNKALKGEIKNVVGVDIKFPVPEFPDLIINNNDDISIDAISDQILDKIEPIR